jgi:hypothetical protein
MDPDAVERAMQRLASAAEGRTGAADVDAALERARHGVERLAQSAAELEASLPTRVGDAVRDGVRAEALPVARQVAEVRGLLNTVIARLERVEGDLLAERHARVDDLAVLVDLVTSGWKSVDRRLERIEAAVGSSPEAVVYRIEERRPPSTGSAP